ncbi:MAG TPA: prolipoprotein diacylglyceryl transferase [Clostridiales bacterium]|nr:prolipoprotein diacylglyceryl transferase [Clostridiales bacterium]
MGGTIEFPKLGLRFLINRIAFWIFNIPIYWYGIIIAFAFLLAVLLALKHCRKYNIDPDNFIDAVLYLTPASIIGARLYYVAFSWDDFRGNLLDIINTRKGGLAIYGGILGALLAVFIYTRVKKINFLELLDFGIPYLPMAQAIGRWGNFVNQEAYGVNTDLPWGMTGDAIKYELALNMEKLKQMGININPEKPVHPTFLYESLWDLGVFLILIWFRKRKKANGEVLFMYAILYGIGRAWIEELRTDSLMAGNIRISRLLSIIFVIAFSVLFYIKRKRHVLSTAGKTGQLGTSSYGGILKELQEDESTETGEIDESTETGEIDESTETGEIDESNKTNEIDKSNETNEINENKE